MSKRPSSCFEREQNKRVKALSNVHLKGVSHGILNGKIFTGGRKLPSSLPG
jgi:hypothetical protein